MIPSDSFCFSQVNQQNIHFTPPKDKYTKKIKDLSLEALVSPEQLSKQDFFKNNDDDSLIDSLEDTPPHQPLKRKIDFLTESNCITKRMPCVFEDNSSAQESSRNFSLWTTESVQSHLNFLDQKFRFLDQNMGFDQAKDLILENTILENSEEYSDNNPTEEVQEDDEEKYSSTQKVKNIVNIEVESPIEPSPILARKPKVSSGIRSKSQFR